MMANCNYSLKSGIISQMIVACILKQLAPSRALGARWGQNSILQEYLKAAARPIHGC